MTRMERVRILAVKSLTLAVLLLSACGGDTTGDTSLPPLASATTTTVATTTTTEPTTTTVPLRIQASQWEGLFFKEDVLFFVELEWRPPVVTHSGIML